jgi:hypothetical protein
MVGMAMLVASEGMLFALLIGSYFFLRFKQVHWPPPGVPEPKVVVPLILLGHLSRRACRCSSRPARRRVGRVRAAQALILLALVVQAGYFAMQVHLYADDLGDFTPQAARLRVALLHTARRRPRTRLRRDPVERVAAREADGRPGPRTGGRGRRRSRSYWHAVNRHHDRGHPHGALAAL